MRIRGPCCDPFDALLVPPTVVMQAHATVSTSPWVVAVGLVFDTEGRRIGMGSRVVRFAGLPLQLYVSPGYPYVVSLQDWGIEVHNTQTASA